MYYPVRQRAEHPATNQNSRRINVLTLFVCNIHSKITESTFEHFLQQGGLTYARLRMPEPAPVRHDHYAANAVETRRTTVALQPDYRDYPPTGADVSDKGAR